MLRLQPSEIITSRQEVFELKQRMDARRLLRAIGFTHVTDKPIASSDVPQLQGSTQYMAPFNLRGPQNRVGRGSKPNMDSQDHQAPGEAESEDSVCENKHQLPGTGRPELLHSHETSPHVQYRPRNSRSVSRLNRSSSISLGAMHKSHEGSSAEDVLLSMGEDVREAQSFRPRSLSDPGHDEIPPLTIPRRRQRETAANSVECNKGFRNCSASLYASSISEQDVGDISETVRGFTVTSTASLDHAEAQNQSLEAEDAAHGCDLLMSKSSSIYAQVMMDAYTPLIGAAPDQAVWSSCLPFRGKPLPEWQNEKLSTVEKSEILLPSDLDEAHQRLGSSTYTEVTSDGPEEATTEINLPEQVRLEDEHTMLVERLTNQHLASHDTIGPAHTNFTMMRGGRPRYSTWQEGRTERRRRLRCNAEQENEDNMEEFEEERSLWVARVRGYTLERTPPGRGRLERLL